MRCIAMSRISFDWQLKLSEVLACRDAIRRYGSNFSFLLSVKISYKRMQYAC